MVHFMPLKNVKEVGVLIDNYNIIQNDLKKDIMLDFEAAYVSHFFDYLWIIILIGLSAAR